MKNLLLTIFICVLNIANSQDNVYVKVVGGVDDWTVEPDKEYLITTTTKIKNIKFNAVGSQVKLIYRNNKYYIITACEGEVLVSISTKRGKPLGPPCKIRSKYIK